MKQVKNQRGSMIFEGILVVIILALIGYIGYQVYMARTQPTAQSDQTANQPAKKDPYAGFKAYQSTQGKSSFKYPSSWQIQDDTKTYSDPHGIKIQSPTGLIVSFYPGVGGIGGGCDPDPNSDMACPLINTYTADKQGTGNSETIFYVEAKTTTKDGNGASAAQYSLGLTGDTGNAKYAPTVGSEYKFPLLYRLTNKTADDSTIFSAQYPKESAQNSLSQSAFYDLPDVKKAKLIFQSFKFN